MFKPTSAKDRINYGEVLMPPIGFHLNQAVGTTYSLDLETLTAVSLVLGLAEDTDSELISNPISLLSAFQKISDKIIVFCEAGQIKMPVKSSAFCLILEKMVVPVSLPWNHDINRYPSFHPKTWLLEYENTAGEKRYRFIVMSRNMTFDHSWDIACTLDGDLTSDSDVDSRPLVDFLKFLKGQLDENFTDFLRRRNNLDYLINTVSEVRFHVDERFSGCEIMPMGIGSEGYDMHSDSLFTDSFHELVVMSPFITGNVIAQLNNPGKTLGGTRRTLITRRSELEKIKNGKASNFDVYVMKDEIIDGESSISDGEDSKEETDPSKQDIHAKVYVRRKNNTTDLYLGSMNASYAAIHANVEMMLRLRTRKHIFNGEMFLDDIMGDDRSGKKNPFELVSPENEIRAENTSLSDRVEKLIKTVCRIKMSAAVEKTDGKYDVHITADLRTVIEGIRIRPLRSNKESELMKEMSFRSLDLIFLSEFYVVSATIDDCTLNRVIMIPTSGIPEERDNEIIKNVIKTRNQFIEYIAFILGDDYVQSFLENKKASTAYIEWDKNNAMPAVYEKMLKTSVSNPGRLNEIKAITKAIQDDEVIPPEFRDMYGVFCDTLGLEKD